MANEKTEEKNNDYDHKDGGADSPDPEMLVSNGPAIDPRTGEYKLVRKLKNRHISMIRSALFFSLSLYTPWKLSLSVLQGLLEQVNRLRTAALLYLSSYSKVCSWAQQTPFGVVVLLVAIIFCVEVVQWNNTLYRAIAGIYNNWYHMLLCHGVYWFLWSYNENLLTISF